MKLYYADVLKPRPACAVARLLELPIEYIYLDLGKGEHLTPDYWKLNPNAKVPTLVDGESVLWESNAIMCYLADKAGSSLWPRDTARQIDIVRWFGWSSDHFTACGGALYFEYVIKPRFGLGEADETVVESALADFRRYAAVLDAHLRGRSHLVGEALSVADFAVAVTLPYADQARLPLEEFPDVQPWHDQLNALDAWRSPFPAD